MLFGSIRKFFFSLIAVFVGVLMVVMFTLPGEVAGGRNQVVGKLNGKPISYSQESVFANNVHQISEYYKRQGLDATEGFSRYIQLQAFEQTVSSELAMQASLDYGITLKDEEVLASIRERYFTQDGQFDANGYKSFQKYGKPQVKKNLETMTRQLLHRGYLDHTLFGFVPVGERQRQKRLADLALERKVLLAVIDAEDAVKTSITDEDLRAFHSQNADTLYSGKPFDEVKDEVALEHFSRNKDRLLVDFQRQMSSKLAPLRGAKSKDKFAAEAATLGFEVVDVEPFNVYAKQLQDKDGLLTQFADPEHIIASLFSAPLQSVSSLLRSEGFLVLGFVESQADNERLLGSFRQEQALNEYTEDKRQQLIASFQSFLKDRATIISYLDQEP